jgi:hypothetical protein
LQVAEATANFKSTNEKETLMKRTLISVLTVLLVSRAAWAQNTNAGSKSAKPAKPKPAVDCSGASDAKITADVKAKLAAAPSLKDLAIDVATSAGAVTLTGSAKKPTQKGTATRVAKSVPCVKKVDNKMTVEGAPPPPPPKNSNSRKKAANKNM